MFTASLVASAMVSVVEDLDRVWFTMNLFLLVCVILYLPLHLRRRVKLGIEMPLVSKLTAVGYAIFGVVLLLALFGLGLKPSLGLFAAGLIYGIVTNTLIFMQFLGTFVAIKKEA